MIFQQIGLINSKDWQGVGWLYGFDLFVLIRYLRIFAYSNVSSLLFKSISCNIKNFNKLRNGSKQLQSQFKNCLTDPWIWLCSKREASIRLQKPKCQPPPPSHQKHPFLAKFSQPRPCTLPPHWYLGFEGNGVFGTPPLEKNRPPTLTQYATFAVLLSNKLICWRYSTVMLPLSRECSQD